MALVAGYKGFYAGAFDGQADNSAVSAITIDGVTATQAASGSRTVLKKNGANSRSRLFFDGNDFYDFGDNFDLGTNSFAFFCVMKWQGGGFFSKAIAGSQARYGFFQDVTLGFVYQNASGVHSVDTGLSAPDTEPHLYEAYINRTTGNLKVFRDGVQLGSTASFTPDTSENHNTNLKAYIGRYADNGVFDSFFAGEIYEMAFYLRGSEFSNAEIVQNRDAFNAYYFPPPDTEKPSDVTNLTIDANFNINSDAATDNVGVDRYRTQYKDDSGNWTDFSSQLIQFVGNQNLLTAVGTHTRFVRRKAVDAAGNESLNWSNVASVVYISPAPSVAITTPAHNSILSGTVNVAATVANFPNIAGVTFKLDDTNIAAEDTNSPYSVHLDTTLYKNGDYTLRAFARAADNSIVHTAISVSIFNLFSIGDSFEWDRVRRPEYYYPSSPDWKAVTATHEYQDAGASFNEFSDNPPRTWELRYTGLTPEKNKIFEDHFNLKRISRPFNFVAKNGMTFTNVFYQKSEASWNGTDSNNITRSIVLIKYP